MGVAKKEGSFESSYYKQKQKEEEDYRDKKWSEQKKQKKQSFDKKTINTDIKPTYLKNATLEPVLNNNEPKWLTIKTVVSPPKSKQEAELILKGELEGDKEVVFGLVEPGIWICKKCGGRTQSKNEMPVYCTECKRNSSFTQLTEAIPEGIWKLPKWREIDELDMLGVFDDMYSLIKRLVVFPEEMHYKLFILWIISTWKRECWESVGFPVFRGLVSSGKTTALNILSELCYRAVPVSNVTFAALGRISHYWHATLLIDEADNRLNPHTEAGSIMLDFVKASYKRGSKYITADVNDQKKTIPIDNFGFKAFAGEKSFNPSLVSRALNFFMEQDLPEIPKLSYVQDELDDLQTRLLNYRYKTNDPPDLGRGFTLRGRTREIYESIIATGMHIGVDINDIIEYVLELEKEQEEEMRNTVQWEILRILKDKQEIRTLDDSPEMILVSDILIGINWDADDRSERHKNSIRLGYILKNMGLKTTHTMNGRSISLVGKNAKRLNRLYKRYKI